MEHRDTYVELVGVNYTTLNKQGQRTEYMQAKYPCGFAKVNGKHMRSRLGNYCVVCNVPIDKFDIAIKEGVAK